MAPISGIETEYGVAVLGMGDNRYEPAWAARLLLAAYQQLGRPYVHSHGTAIIQPESQEYASLFTTKEQTLPDGFATDVMLANGARLYIDHGHSEYATPETLSTRQLTAADKAGERIIMSCLDWIEQQDLCPPEQSIHVYKNNSDYQNHSYGCHENYLLSRTLFENLLSTQSTNAFACWIPFLITRTLLCGAGKVGGENGSAPAGFQLTQRADFFECLRGTQTMHRRPLLNTRDEPHADQQQFSRLHVILGDANLAECSTYLKIGSAQLILQLLETDHQPPDLTLADPLAALHTVSRDLSFRELLTLQDGRRMSALDMQYIFLERVERHLHATGGSPEQWEVWQLWREVLDKLPERWTELSTILDWAIKRQLLQRYLHAQNASWDDVRAWQPVIEETQLEQAQALANHLDLSWHDYEKQRHLYFRLRKLDIAYHDIRDGSTEHEPGLYYHLQQRGAITRLLANEEIDRLVSAPPADTRAALRGAWIAHASQTLLAVDWERLYFVHPPTSEQPETTLLLDDPGTSGMDELIPFRQQNATSVEDDSTSEIADQQRE